MEKEYYRKENFWATDKNWDAVPVTDELIKKAELRLDKKLTSSYLELLKIQNGGAINYPYFNLEDQLVWMDHLFGIDFEDAELGVGIFASGKIVEERQLPIHPSKVVIIYGDFYHYIGLDYRQTNENPPVIYFWEIHEDGPAWGEIELSASFDEFLSKLYRIKTDSKKSKKKTAYKQRISLRFTGLYT